MELNLDAFKETIEKSEIIYLATSAHDEVSVRPVSPLLLDDMVICFYTASDSRKYKQMKINPRVAFSVGPMGGYLAEGTVRFLGSVFSEENAAINASYRKRYEGAFEMTAPGENLDLTEFVVIDLNFLKGWIFDESNPEIPLGIGEMTF